MQDGQGLGNVMWANEHQLFQSQAAAGGVIRIETLVQIDINGYAFLRLGVGHDPEGESGHARTGNAVDFADPAAGQAADNQCVVQGRKPGRDVGDGAGLIGF